MRRWERAYIGAVIAFTVAYLLAAIIVGDLWWIDGFYSWRIGDRAFAVIELSCVSLLGAAMGNLLR